MDDSHAYLNAPETHNHAAPRSIFHEVLVADVSLKLSKAPLEGIQKKMTYKVYVGHTHLNEYENNPELIGGPFSDLLPFGYTRNDLGKGVHYSLSWCGLGFYPMYEDLQNIDHPTILFSTKRLDMRRICE